jgi:hypothetical protein
MTSIYHHPLDNLSTLNIQAQEAQIVTWQGRKPLKLSNGLAVLPFSGSQYKAEVLIGAESGCYPGIAFHIQDEHNYELVYAQPHTSGQWDAVQYDPVFNGSNTWQLYHGNLYQAAADIPTQQWFKFQIEVDVSTLRVSINDRPQLVVSQLSHPCSSGNIGLWTFLPAFFSDFKVSPIEENLPAVQKETPPDKAIPFWFLEDFGEVQCEPNGILNLNRYLPFSTGKAHLSRKFVLA